MLGQRRLVGALIVGLLVAQPVGAQQKAAGIAVRGGGFNGVSDLNEAGTADFNKTGYNVGGSIGVELNKYIAVRGDFTFARNELQQNGAAAGIDLNRFFYDASIQFQSGSNGFTPYAYLGAGAVTLHPVGTSDNNKTKFAGTGGVGAQYSVPGTNLGILVEGKAWVYELSGLAGSLSAFDKTTVDVTWSAGLSYRIPFATSAARR